MKKLFISLTVIVSVICCLCVTVFAVDDEHPNYFYDFDDYATYSADSSTGLISADIKLPSDWLWLCAIDRDGYTSLYNGTNYVVLEPSRSPYSWRFNPFFRFQAVNPSVGYRFNDARFLDLNFIPNGAYFDLEFYYTISSGTDSTYSFSDMYLVYVDSQGVVVRTDRIEPSFTATPVQSSVTRYDFSARYYFSNVPQNAEGFYYAISIQHGFADVGIDIPVSSVTNKLTFKYSELDFNIKQNQVIRDKVSNIEKQLGDLVNRPMVPIAPPGQNDFDDLHNNEQELLDQSQNYLDNGLSFFQNASGVILGLGNGFEAIKVLVQPVFALPFANSLITVSVSLGLVATLIGVAISSISNGEDANKAGKKNSKAGKKTGKGG